MASRSSLRLCRDIQADLAMMAIASRRIPDEHCKMYISQKEKCPAWMSVARDAPCDVCPLWVFEETLCGPKSFIRSRSVLKEGLSVSLDILSDFLRPWRRGRRGCAASQSQRAVTPSKGNSKWRRRRPAGQTHMGRLQRQRQRHRCCRPREATQAVPTDGRDRPFCSRTCISGPRGWCRDGGRPVRQAPSRASCWGDESYPMTGEKDNSPAIAKVIFQESRHAKRRA